MRYNKIREMDVSNGEGLRVSIFVQGCTFNCTGCFNPETHDFNGGKEFTDETIKKILELCKRKYIKGLSILGGEPLHERNVEDVFKLVSAFKEKFPNKDIWLWTGFLFDNAMQDRKKRKIIKHVDYLVDGQFFLSQKDYRLKWAGSKNQKLIDVKATMKKGEVVTSGMLQSKEY